MAKVVGFLVAAVLLAACTGPQPSLYAPKDGRDGYAEEALPKGLYRVTFQGNRFTSRERAENYALYRAAELTLELGATDFVLHDKLTERLTKVTRDYAYDPWGYPVYHRGSYRYRYRYRPPPVIQREDTTFLAQVTIEPYSGTPPEAGFQSLDARAVLKRLTAAIERPPQAAGP